MSRWTFLAVMLLSLGLSGSATAADTWVYTEGTYHSDGGVTYRWGGGGTPRVQVYCAELTNYDNIGSYPCAMASYIQINNGAGALVDSIASSDVWETTCDVNVNPAAVTWSGDVGANYYVMGSVKLRSGSGYCDPCITGYRPMSVTATFTTEDPFTVSGATGCLDNVTLYIHDGATYQIQNYTTLGSSYSFPIFENHDYMLVFSNGAYYDFTCDGDEVFGYDACIYVYGYTCGIDTIKLRDDNSQLIDQVNQSSGYDIYEMIIEDGEEYTISFYDMGILLCYNQTFTCTGDHVLIDFDRCNWVYPPNLPAPPYIIYLWTGYDYNIVVFRDEHGNFIENSQLAIYDNTDSQYIQRWADASDGYTLLGTRFATDHDVQLMLRTFDGVFTLDTTYPANGSAPVGEEDITITNWTIPIKYNLNVLPVDQYGAALFDVFCGLSEYTPLNPGAFWGMDLSDQGYVPVTNCSGFAMCDIIAEKEGYADYKVEALNWTSKSALVKDYRHNIVMEVEV